MTNLAFVGRGASGAAIGGWGWGDWKWYGSETFWLSVGVVFLWVTGISVDGIEGFVIREFLGDFWPWLVTVLHIGGATSVTLHAVLKQREVRSAIGWIGLAWLAPVVGPLLYLCLGINRIRRIGISLGLQESWKMPQEGFLPTSEEVALRDEVLAEFPALIGLTNLGSRITGRPVLLGNSVEPLINGDTAYPAMLEAIEGARESIALLSYIFDSDRAGEKFFGALCRAMGRGVQVRVLIDGVGARYSKPSMIGRLRQAGIPVAGFLESRRPRFLRYANLRNHRKILVVDGRTGFTGGTNIREGHWFSMKPGFPVACVHFRIEGPVVADLQRVFAVDWAFTTGESLTGEIWFPKYERAGHVAARGISEGPDEDLDKIAEAIMGALAVAKSRVFIATPYFLPDDALQRALVVTAMRGVEIDIVLPARNNIRIMDWAVMALLEPLIGNGCRVHRSPEPFDHTKLMVVDGVWSLIGSSNWDARSLRLNFEFNVECYSPDLAGSLEKIVGEKISRAHEMTLEEVRNRPLPQKIRDGVARLGLPYL